MIDKLVLGTVQFGLNYGINNSNGMPSEEEVFKILDTAYENGIYNLDTADAYGDAISVIGKYHRNSQNKFNILSKFRSVKFGDIERVVTESLEKLNIDKFQVFSYHSFKDYTDEKNLSEDLVKLKVKGLVNKIGISVYTNSELERVIDESFIDVIQLPYNILDNDNIRGQLISRAKRNGKDVHVRSVFLQGLFFMDFEGFPHKLIPLKSYIKKIADFCIIEHLSMESLALSYVLFNKSIDQVLIGIDNKIQLEQNLKSIINNSTAFDFINENIFVNETELLNPVNWK